MPNRPQDLILYIGATCPFCLRVVDFMQAHQIDISIIDVWSDDKAFEEMTELSGSSQVPCLKYDDQYMLESADIISQLAEWFNV